MTLSNFPLLSFFTGGGLLDIGFIDTGFSIIWHNESDGVIADGYEYAIEGRYGPNRKTVLRIQNREPIERTSARRIERQAFSRDCKPETFGIIGGPPCPDFSSAGLHKGKHGSNGILSGTYVSRILALKPTFFVLENVPGLLRTAKHRVYLSELLQRLEGYYSLDVSVLNALNFGVPQDRNRVFVVGFRRDWLDKERGLSVPTRGQHWGTALDGLKLRMFRDPRGSEDAEAGIHWFHWPYNSHYFAAKWRYPWPQTSPFGCQPEKPDGIPGELMIETHIGAQAHLHTLPNGQDSFQPHSSKFDTVAEGDVKGKSFKRLHRWRYSPTAAYGNREVHLHPYERRRLTVREAMRIQSVPDDYALPDNISLGTKFKMISNGVPVKLAAVLAKQIASFLVDDQPASSPP